MKDLIELTFTILKKEWNEGERKCVMRDVASEALTSPGAVMMYPSKGEGEPFPADINDISASIKFGELCFYMSLADEDKPIDYNPTDVANEICELRGSEWYVNFTEYFEPLLNAGCMGIPKSKMN